jgi:hypothetical protein
MSVVNSLLAKFLLRGPKDMKIAGREIWTVRRVVHNLPATVKSNAPAAVLSMVPGDCVFFAID